MRRNILLTFLLAASSGAAADCIEGFVSADSDVGVEMCTSGDDVVQIIDLTKGAKLEFLYEKSGGKFKQRSISDIWRDFADTEEDAFSVVNGTFFRIPEGESYISADSVGIAFLLKKDGVVETEGYEDQDDYWYRKVLKIRGRSAVIDDDLSYTYIEEFSDALGGLSTSANKRNWAPFVGRNLVGVSADGGKIFVLVSDGMSVVDAEGILREFGAVNVMMLDGSNSAQLRSNRKNVTNKIFGRTRPIPQAIGILRGGESSSCNSGQLLASREGNLEPNGSYFYSSTSGTYSATLSGKSDGSTDFNLYLYRWSNRQWTMVESSTSSTSNESVEHSGGAGYYTFYVYSYRGSGSYEICVQKP